MVAYAIEALLFRYYCPSLEYLALLAHFGIFSALLAYVFWDEWGTAYWY